MNQHNFNTGSFDPNKNEYQPMTHQVDYSHQQHQQVHDHHHQNQQQQPSSYVMQGFDFLDTTDFLLQPDAASTTNQPIVSYNTVDYSGGAYFDQNPQPIVQHQQIIYHQQTSPIGNHHQQYYANDAGGPSSGQSEYAYYGGQQQSSSGMHQPQNHYGQMGTQQQQVYVENRSMIDQVHQQQQQQQQIRPQPMTAEQLQLSQQRLLGIAIPQPSQVGNVQQPTVHYHQQPQHHEQQQQQLFSAHVQRSQGHLQLPLQQPQSIVVIPQQFPPAQQTSQLQQHHHQGLANYGNYQTYSNSNVGSAAISSITTATAAPVASTAPPHGSPTASSQTSSGTEGSDEVDEPGVASSPYKRSSPGDAGAKRQGKKRKVQKDPNEPQKPVSAYALFFRDTQAAIKGQNPSATFGDVSKIVASMWDNLDQDGKNLYRQKTELAKKDYLKELAVYRAKLLSKGNQGQSMPIAGPQTNFAQMDPMRFQQPQPPQQQMMYHHGQQQQPWFQHHQYPDQSTSIGSINEFGGKTLATLISEPKPQQQLLTTTTTSTISARPIKQEQPSRPEPLAITKPDGACIRAGCHNAAVESSQWDGEYCTDACVSKNCRDIFAAWVQSKQPPQSSEAIAPS